MESKPAVRLARRPQEGQDAELVACLVRQDEAGAAIVPPSPMAAIIERAQALGDFAGKEGQTLLHYPEAPSPERPWPRLLAVGLGKGPVGRETLRQAGGSVAVEAGKTRASRIMVLVPEDLPLPLADAVEALSEGLILGAYQFRRYKAESADDPPGQLATVWLAAPPGRGLAGACRRGGQAARAACLARDMGNEPANVWTPARFAALAQELAGRHGLPVSVLEQADLECLGMGGLLAVGGGSGRPPCLVTLEYRTGRQVPTVLLVGKGLTFDSGGLCLKNPQGMDEMKYDMCGGAAVLALLRAVAAERPRHLDVVAMVAAAENLPGPQAMRPGDVLRLFGGKCVEVANTDAEGRLILADALAYGIDRFAPAAVVDVATLTGAVVVGLGHHRTGLFANDDRLASRLLAAGERSGEPLWRLPLGPEYTKQLKSEVADLRNIGGKDGGSITAAAFLGEFVGKTPWAHLDIAGTAWGYTEKPYVKKGASGVGVRTLLELIRGW
ncbi:MAG: leucyl aminopeptidase [Thermodesulfobacteriota bacterium]